MSRTTDQLLLDAEALAGFGRWSYDLDTKALTFSPGMHRIHDLPRDAPLELIEFLLSGVHPDDYGRLRTLMDTVENDPGSIPEDGVRMQYRALRPDGSTRFVQFHGRIVGRCWTGVAQDVSPLRHYERGLRVHHAVTRAVQEWACFQEGAVGLLRRVATALECTVGALWILDGDRLVARACWSSGAPEAVPFVEATRQTRFAKGEGGPGEAWATSSPVVEPELRSRLPSGRRDAAIAAGLRSAMALPIVDREFIGVLGVYCDERREPEESLAQTLSSVGQQLGRFLVERRSELQPGRLSARELEVLTLAAEGFSGPRIAERLTVSPATVKTHFEHIYEKLGVGDRAAAVAHALRSGVIA